MSQYKTRTIAFKETLKVGDWSIKVSTIVKEGGFSYPDFYKHMQEVLPQWLSMDNSFDSSNDKIGFLILHAGNEGIFSILNWWLDRHMLNTHIFLSEYDKPDHFKQISGDGLAPCIWELEVINRERISWVNNVLKKEPKPDFEAYLEGVYSGIF